MHIQNKSWYLVDVQNKTLGRTATRIANILKGKNSINYLSYLDNGNYIIVINAAKIKVTGNKNTQKNYYNHLGKPGHLKKQSFTSLQQSSPKNIIEKAVQGMLPKNSLRKQLLTKLKIYKLSKHPHSAQKPVLLDI